MQDQEQAQERQHGTQPDPTLGLRRRRRTGLDDIAVDARGRVTSDAESRNMPVAAQLHLHQALEAIETNDMPARGTHFGGMRDDQRGLGSRGQAEGDREAQDDENRYDHEHEHEHESDENSQDDQDDDDDDQDDDDDINSIIDHDAPDMLPNQHRRRRQSAETLQVEKPWKLSHVYCLASLFVATLAILAAPIPTSPHVGLMNDLKKNKTSLAAASTKTIKMKSKESKSTVTSEIIPNIWSFEYVAKAALVSVENSKNGKNKNKQATKDVTDISSSRAKELQDSSGRKSEHAYARIQQVLRESASSPSADTFHAINQIATDFLFPDTDTPKQDPKLPLQEAKKAPFWLKSFTQDMHSAHKLKEMIPPSDSADSQVGTTALSEQEGGLIVRQTEDISWFHATVLESPYLKWIDPTILHPSASTPTDLVNKVISSRPRLVAMANLFLSLTYILHAIVAGWFLGTILNRSSMRRGENAVVMGGEAENVNINPDAPPSGLIIDWTGAAGVRERMAGFLIFKMLLMAQVVDIPENFSYLILLTWYTCLSCLRSWDHLCHASTMHSAASGQAPRGGELQLLTLVLFCDILAVSSCVGLFYSIGVSMVVLLTCDCALLAVDVTGHMLKHFMCVMEDAHSAAVTRLQSRQLSLHRQRRARNLVRNNSPDSSSGAERILNEQEQLGNIDDDADHQIESLEFVHARRLSLLDTSIFVLQIVHDIITVSHFLHIWRLHGVQFTLIDGVLALHLHSAISSACRKITQRRNVHSIARDLDNMFPDASDMELRKADVCCICLGHMSHTNGKVKKVRCGHLYHAQCLREVVERAQSIHEAKCPLCRCSLCHSDSRDPSESERNNPTPPPQAQPQAPQQQQQQFLVPVANERALFRFTTENIIPAWLPIPAFSFEVVRRPSPGVATAVVEGNEINRDAAPTNLQRQPVDVQQIQEQPEENNVAIMNDAEANNIDVNTDATDDNRGNNSPSILRRFLVLAGAIPMSPEEEARALASLVDMFPQYDRRDLLRELRDRGSAETVVEAVLMGNFRGVAR